MRRLVKNATYAGRNFAGSHRSVDFVLRLNRDFARSMTRRDTAACIEGFPRSANTSAVVAFRRCNPEARLAHHLHVPTQVLRAVDFGVPCAVLLRAPLDALASVAIVDPNLSDSLAIGSYVNFHARTLHLASEVCVCPFERVIADPGIVAERLNERYDTTFARLAPLDAEQREAFVDSLGESHRRWGRPEGLLPVPSEDKERRKAVVRERLAAHPRFPEAEQLYREWAAAAG